MKSLLNILSVAVLLLLASCGAPKEMAYISDAERDSAHRILSTYSNTIHPGDQLYIYVNSEAIESVIAFNQETHTEMVEMSRLNTARYGRPTTTVNDSYTVKKIKQVPGYHVDEQGFILFPIIGKVQAVGISYDSLQNLLQRKLKDGGYVNDAVVTVSPMNFRVSVVGEVRAPREIHVTGERLTIFEALAMCGDITDSGMRSNVVVMREKNGELTPIQIDLTKKTIFDSEVYYLQQNDIVYVEPTLLKKRRAERNQNWPQYISSTVSVAVLLRNLYRIWFIRVPTYL